MVIIGHPLLFFGLRVFLLNGDEQVQPGIKWNPAEHPATAFELHTVLETESFLIGKC